MQPSESNNNKSDWIKYINWRIKNNKNFLAFISGPTGSGKSTCGLTICEMIDPNFTIENVVFSALELMKLINTGKLKRGSAILFDEPQVTMSNRTWQSKINKVMNYLFTTFRHKGYVLIMASPYLDFIDAGTRKLFHAEFQTQGIDFDKQTVKLKPYCIQYNSRNKKFYYKYLRIRSLMGYAPIKAWYLGLPTKELLDEYEKHKTSFTTKLNNEIMEELDPVKKVELSRQQNIIYQKRLNGMSVPQIAKEMNMSEAFCYRQFSHIKKKNWPMPDIRLCDTFKPAETLTPEMRALLT